MADDAFDLRVAVRRGVAWSTASNLVLRFGTLLLGVVLARLLTPEEFGVFAVALTVQAVLMTLADLGFSAELIRASDPARRAPTVATLGIITGGIAALTMGSGAGELAALLGSPTSAPAIAVLSLTLLLTGVGVVPYATLQREFRQKEIFAIALCDFAVSTLVTIVLVAMGWGVMALAVGRVLAHTLTCVLQFVVTGQGLRLGCDRDLLGPIVRFGLPIAAANMFSWVLLSSDKVALARMAGPVELGFYVLAFNISNWPMSALGQVVRAVALPGFSRMEQTTNDTSLARGFALTWSLAVPAGLALTVLSSSVIATLYGAKWHPAAAVLAALGVFGALRLGFDIIVAYLLARGRSAATLWIQVGWLVALVPALIVGINRGGIVGAAWAHVAVAAVVVAPAYLYAASQAGADVSRLLASSWPPILAVLPAMGCAALVARALDAGWAALVIGGLVFSAIYLLLLGRWLRRLLRSFEPLPSDRTAPEYVLTAAPESEVP